MFPLIVLVFIASFLGTWYVLRIINREDQKVLERLHRVATQRSRQAPSTKEVEPVSPLFLAARLFAHAIPLRRFGSCLDTDLARADIPLRGEEFMAGMILAAIAGWLAGSVLVDSLYGVATIAIIAAAAPLVALRLAKVRRLSTFNTQLGDALAMMSNTLRAGFGFAQAMDMVAKEMPAPISKEFARCLKEMNLGLATEEALQNLVSRVGSDDLDLLVTAVIIQRQVGGNLAEVLDKIHETIRERVCIKGEIRTLTAQGRISGSIIGLLPLALAALLFIINPDYLLGFTHNQVGLSMVVYAIFSEILGVVLVRRIINIDV